MFKPTLKNLLLFMVVGSLVGFLLGTGTLFGPVRWITAWVRNGPWSPDVEGYFVRLLMIVLIVTVFVISLLFTAVVLNTRTKHVIWGMPLMLFIVAGVTLYMWLKPGMLNVAEVLESHSGKYRFTVGSYPDRSRMIELKKRGYTAIISLLHPAVVPFEPKLLAEEKKISGELGIELIHMPMLPWISENEEVLDKIRDLAVSGTGRYYIHCYMGKDRVNVVRSVIERAGGSIKPGVSRYGRKHRSLSERDALERGIILVPEKGVYVIPYPTDEEYLTFILADDIRNVVSLLDSEKIAQAEGALLARHGVNYHIFPVSDDHYDPAIVLKAAQLVWRLPRPVVIHGFKNPSPRTEAFIQAFLSNRAPLPPCLFKSYSSTTGGIEVIAPHVALGFRPTSLREYENLLDRGIRKFVYFGNSSSDEAARDREFMKAASLEWYSYKSDDAEWPQKLGQEGPWYIYGPESGMVTNRITELFGSAVPSKILFDPAVLLDVAVEEKVDTAIKIKKPRGFIERMLFFLQEAVPLPGTALLLMTFTFFYTGLSGAYVGWLRMTKGVRTAYTRKIFHFLIFTMASVIQWRGGLSAIMVFGSTTAVCVIYAVFRGKGFPFYEAMARPGDEPHRTFYILVPLITTALGGVISNIFFMRFAHIGYLVGGWGDAVGEPVGSRFGKHRYHVPSLLGVKATRSIEGSISVFLVGFIAALSGFLLMGGIPGQTALLCAAACAAAGMCVEAVSTHGLDNLTIQVVVAGMAVWILGC